MVRSCIHFGAGALGRGLVVPRLVEAGWAVTVVDPLRDLLRALRLAGGYTLEMRPDSKPVEVWVPLAGALHPQDDVDGIGELLATATLVTTAVRKENLGATAGQLAAAWGGRMPDHVCLVACENVERVDEVLNDVLAATCLPPERRARVAVPRTVVDRICASDWPDTTSIRTEAYAELSASEMALAVPGVDVAHDIDAVFDRKRYLVNTLADAAAILGLGRGYIYLSEAFRDGQLLAELAPLVAALKLYLELRHGFTMEELDAYAATSFARLSDDYIPRRLDTVARDVWRKLEPAERFFAPMIELQRRGRLGREPLALLARLVERGNEVGGDRRDVEAALRGIAATDGLRDPALRATYELVAALSASARKD